VSRVKKKAPSEDLDMDEHLARLKAEAEDERRRVYMERFGTLPEMKHKEKLMSLDDFN
jgi:hypothetical protein